MRIFYLLFLFPCLLLAQPTPRAGQGWQELTISDGLSQGMIYGLEQDRNGFIWVATKDGLNRYDGYNFTVFTHDPYNEYSLSDNTCTALFIDSKGRIWVGTGNRGLNLYDDRTGRFYHTNISDEKSPNAGNYEIRLIAEAPDGSMWVNTDKHKLFRVQLPDALKTNFPTTPDFTGQTQVRSFTIPNQFPDPSALHIRFNPNGTALVGTHDGVFTFNWRQPTAIRPTRLAIAPPPSLIMSDYDSRADYWFSAHMAGIQGRKREVTRFVPFDKPNRGNTLLRFVDARTVAIVTIDYLWLVSADELMTTDSLTARNAFIALPPNQYDLRTLLRDQTGNIWIGTSGYGLRKLIPKTRLFQSYLPLLSLNNLYQDAQQRTYALQLGRYQVLDRATNQLRPLPDLTVQQAGQNHRFLMQDRRGDFWLAVQNIRTGEQQLIQYDRNWQRRKTYALPAGITFGAIGNRIIDDRNGGLWIGVSNGNLLHFHPETGLFDRLSYRHLLPKGGAQIETFALYEDGMGTIWIGTVKGLIRIQNPTSQPTFSIYKNSGTDRQSLSNDFVSSIVDDPHQPSRYLWVSTKGGGLERLDKQSRSDGPFTHITEAQGLPNKVVYGLLVDKFKNLWMSTNRGLAQFNLQTGKFRTYTKADGLQDDEFNTSSFCKGPTGELIFGGVNGVTILRAGAVSARKAPPQAHIVGLKINNGPVQIGGPDGILTQSLHRTERLALSHDQNLLTLEFAVMDFTNPAKNRYRYRLEGIDEDWVEAGTNRFANYAQLPDGHYRFAMMGSVDGEVWSKPVGFLIRVHPPIYRTWWAYLLYALLLGFVGWQFYRNQLQRGLLQQKVDFEHKEAARLGELDALKTQFFTNISHEFRTPLTLILGPLTDLKRRLKTESAVTLTAPVVDLMERNSTRLLTLINQLLDLSKLEAGQLQPEPEPGNLPAFFRTLAASFESLAQSQQIRFSIEQNQTTWWGMFDRDKFEKILTNLLSNAFKFTPAGNEVRLKVQYPIAPDTGPVRISVADTGIGIAPDQLARIFERFYQVDGQISRKYEGTGIGLALLHELVRVLGGTITVNSAEGVGTSFRVTLPVEPVPETGSAGLVSPADAQTDVDTAPSRPVPTQATELIESTSAENRLLIIDDNSDIRAYVRSIFEGDYQILEAADGQEGIELATAQLPNVVICDLMMPRLDGFGFCRALKTAEATSHIPVVMLTAKATLEDRIEGYELGADDYLTKPFNRAELQARVRNLVQQRERLYQHFALSPLPPATGAPPAAGVVEPTKPALLAAEQKFLDRLAGVVLQQIDNADFSVEVLAEAANLSRTQLHRKLRAVANTTATNFIRDIRLSRAAELLTNGEESVSQVAFAVGFDNLSYFAKVFQERYGVLPSHYARKPAATGE